MADRLTKCTACDGRGYFRCECWPGDCICGWDDQDCEECGGEGIIDNFYSDDLDCDCSNYETDLLEGSARCHRCGRSWTLSQNDIAAEIEHQAAYMAEEVEADANEPNADDRIAFGLVAQGHIPAVEAALSEGADWHEIGRRIGWDGATAKTYYERHLSRTANEPKGGAE